MRQAIAYFGAFYLGVLLTMHSPFSSFTYHVLESISRLP